MIEIKFRVWDKNNFARKISYSKTEIFDDMIGFRFAHFDSDPEDLILMQYTGLKDKNGTEIYEGDILKGNNNPSDLAYVDLGEFGVVNVETEGIVDKVIGWHTKVIPTDSLSKVRPFCLDMPLTQFYIDRAKWEIIGNIYENPDLLEGTNGE